MQSHVHPAKRIVGALIVAFAISAASGTAAKANVWVKPGEVVKGPLPEHPIVELYNPEAPEIIIDKPDITQGAIKAPVAVLIRFVPKDGANIVLDSVKLLYVTFFADIDITDRVRDRITAAGISDNAAELPSGSHDLIIKVKDDKGREASKEIRFDVE